MATWPVIGQEFKMANGYIGKIDQSTITENISVWEVHMYSPFRTTTPSQSEIFSVIVDWSIFSYVFTFQDQNTLPK